MRQSRSAINSIWTTVTFCDLTGKVFYTLIVLLGDEPKAISLPCFNPSAKFLSIKNVGYYIYYTLTKLLPVSWTSSISSLCD